MIRDQRDHQREVAVDGVDEVVVQRRTAAHAHVRSRARPRRARTRSSVSLPRRAGAVGGAEDVDDRGAVAAPVRRARGATAPWMPSTSRIAAATCSGSACVLGDEHLVRVERAGADARVARAPARPVFASPFLAIVSGFELPSWRFGGRDDEREHDRAGDARRDPAAADDELGPARPGAARALVGAPVRPVEARADLRQHDRQQRDRGERAHERDQHAAVADAAQERQRERDQREQADRDGRAAEHDRAARPSPSRAGSPRRRCRPSHAPRASARRSAASSRSPRRGRSARPGTARSARRR